ncbi:MAG: hypothetical protein IJI92_02135 [Erysipelotrichaceae bacterium]|nr:hypothetical protein [Erysipelotrichaceae bacterium]
MKKILIRDYWLIIVSWCIFLEGHDVLAAIIVSAASAVVLSVRSEVNRWRMAAMTLGSFMAVKMILDSGNIPYYFPDLYPFMALIVFNAAAVNECLYNLRYRHVLPILTVCLIAYAIISLIIVIVPQENYSIFSKASLYTMSAFIFLPYLLPLIAHPSSYHLKEFLKRMKIQPAKKQNQV